MSLRAPVAPLAALGVLVASLAGCTAPPPRPVEAGDCLGGTVTTDGAPAPDLDALVDCTEPHGFEVIASLDLPERWTTGDEPLADRRAALLPSGGAYDDFQAWAFRSCGEAAADETGLDGVRIASVAASRALLRPAGAFDLEVALTSEERWAAGEARAVCAVRWTDPETAETRPLALPEGESFADLYDAGLPLDTRRCYAYDEEDLPAVPCDDPHWVEYVATFDAAAVFGDEWAAAAARGLSEDAIRQLDEACAALSPVVDGGVADPPLSYRGLPTETGWDEDGDLPGYREVACAVAAPDSLHDDVVGSLVGIGSGAPDLVSAE